MWERDVIDILSVLAENVCILCDGRIKLCEGSITRRKWTHEENGLEMCPGAPVATPPDDWTMLSD